MQIQINTDNHTDGSSELRDEVQELIEDKLRRFAERITRIEVQLTDENSADKGGPDDHRCVIEARLAGMQPISVTDRGASPQNATRGAVGKMRNLLDSTLGKKERH